MIRFDTRNDRWRWEFDRYIEGVGGSSRVRKSKLLPRGITEAQAAALAAKLEAAEYVRRRLVASVESWDDYVSGLLDRRGSWIYEAIAGCRSRSTSRGRVAALTAQQLADIMRRSQGRCEVTGIQFQIHKAEDSRARPFFHSLDRVDAARGYMADNCRLVCYAANLAMSNWGESVFAQIATGYVVNRYCALGLVQHSLRPDELPGERIRTLSLVG